MTEFVASFLNLEAQELVDYLLRAAGQNDRSSVNPQDLLDLLKLEYLRFDFMTELPSEAKATFAGNAPRAMISFPDRLIATDVSLSANRTRFSVLHEIGHYILPNHQHSLYVCDKNGMSFRTHLMFEQEANRVAADLLFLGDRFDQESNSQSISAAALKTFANQFGASFEATARRMVERTYRDCMLVCFANTSGAIVNPEACPQWNVHYCIPSPSFANRYFGRLQNGSVPEAVFQALSASGRDIQDSETVEVSVTCGSTGQPTLFRAEYFYNRYNVFSFLSPCGT